MADNITKVIITGEDQTGAMFSSFRRNLDEASAASTVLKTSMAALGVAFSAGTAISYIKDITLLAARHETLGVAMNAVGKNAGYSTGEMASYAAGVAKMGITMLESRQNVLSMAQANIDLSKSQQLARIAQDAAVIGNINSSEAMGTLIHGIQSAQVDVLRTIGINVNFEDSYKKLAVQLRKTTDDLTESEKMTARTSAVMESGAGIAGTYEAAMGTAGKQMNSLARYSEDAKVKLGAVFSETLLVAVGAYTGHLKDVNSGMDELAANKKLEKWADDVTTNLVFVADSIKYSWGSVVTVLDTAYTGLDQIFHLLAANPAGAKASGAAWSNRMEDRFGADSSLQVLRQQLAEKRATDARTVWQPGSVGAKPAYQWSDSSGKEAFEATEAFIKGEQNAIAKARSEAETEWAKYIQSTRSKQEQMAQEIKKAQNAAATLGGDTAAQLPKVIAAIREKYDSGYNDAHLALLKAQEDQATKIEDATAKSSLSRLESQHKAQLLSDENYYAQKREAQLAAMNAEEAALLKEMQAQSASASLQIDPAKREQALKNLIELGTKYQEVVIRKAEAEKDDFEWIVKQNQAMSDMQKELDAAGKTMSAYVDGLAFANQERDIEIQALQMAEPLRATYIQQKKEELALEKTLADFKRNGISFSDADVSGYKSALATSQANEAVLNTAKKADEEWKKAFVSMESVGKQAFVSVFTRDGKSAVESMGKAIQTSIIDLLYELTMKKWIVQIETSLVGASAPAELSSGNFGGFLSRLFGGGEAAPGLSASSAASYGPVGSSFGSLFTVGVAHSGYGPGDAMSTRSELASTFSSAPRFHAGIGPGERAAVIRTDESVLTPGQMRQLAPVQAGDGDNTPPHITIKIINQSGQAVSAKQQGGPQPDGRDWILGVVLEAADSNPHFRTALGLGGR